MKRILATLARLPLIGKVFARYEAAYTNWTGNRSYIINTLQDARIDIDSFTRMELQRKHRYWVANSPLVNRIRNLFVQFSVGVEGLKCVSNSTDPAYSASASNVWEDWSRRPELNSRTCLAQLEIQWAGALFDDGEVFIIKTNGRDASNKIIPKLQTVEAHRVRTPSDRIQDEGKTIFDGIEYEQVKNAKGDLVMGRPKTYFITDEVAKNTFVPVDAANILHLFKTRRPGQLRGIPEGFSCMNLLHDFEDFQIFEMQAAKMVSQIGIVETNASGEIDVQNSRRVNMQIGSQNAQGQPVLKNGDQYYKIVNGTTRVTIRAGDDIKNFQAARPAIVTQDYWDFLIGLICCGYNVPKLLVVPFSLQGTVTRADLDVSANAFRANFEIVKYAVEDIYQWVIGWASKFDKRMDGKVPDDVAEVVIRPPRSPNVDIGYTAQALALELETGVKTLQDVYAEKQQDWKVQLRQIAETMSYVHELATEFGLEPAEILVKQIKTSGKSGGGAGGEDTSGAEDKFNVAINR